MATKQSIIHYETHTTTKLQAENHLGKILARLSNCQDSGRDPHQCGTSQSKFYVAGTPG